MCVRQAKATETVNKHSNKSGLKPWKPGQSGNPLGRPQGARSKFSEAAVANLLEDWTTHGPGVLAKVRTADPSTYLRVAFSIIPKDVQIALETRGPMDSDEMRKVRRLVEIIDACGASGIDPENVFAWIEEDLRARLARPVDSETVA
jgi:hypothetical protein